MSNKFAPFSDGCLLYRRATGSDTYDFDKSNFPFYREVMGLPLKKKLYDAIRSHPHETPLVAYNTKEKLAVGFVSIAKRTSRHYSIRHLWTNPNFRKTGIASGLLKYVFSGVKKSGGRKVFLDVLVHNTYAMGLYTKMGFKKLTDSPVLYGTGFISNSNYRAYPLLPINMNSKDEKERLFKIFQANIGQEWINYFEINKDNFKNGYVQSFQHFFFKSIYLNKTNDALMLIFDRNPLNIAAIELYGASSTDSPNMIEESFRILQRKGITYVKLMLFGGQNKGHCLTFLENMKFNTYQTYIMGITL